MAAAEALPTLRTLTLERFGFPDGTHRFADHRSLAIEGPASLDFDVVVRAWIACPDFDDDFLYGQPGAVERVHGSYRASAISTDSYQPMSAEQAHDALDAWLAEQDDPEWDGPAGDPLVELLRAQYLSGRPQVTAWLHERRSVLDRGDVRMLPPATEQQQHEYGFCLNDFTEWLVWSRSDGVLNVLSVGTD